MPSTVYYTPAEKLPDAAATSRAGRTLFEKVLADRPLTLEKPLPVKVHVGEKGNVTFIRPEMFDGIAEALIERGADAFFTDTNVLYTGERTTREKHLALAAAHGFTRLPVVIADGDHGNEFREVEIGKNHFRTAKIGTAIADAPEMVVISHFKGHMLAGFGGAVKQLAMGSASRGGKLAQHAGSKPFINPFSCIACGVCAENCPEGAIEQPRKKYRINRAKCIGCAACSAVCPKGAVLFNPLGSLSRKFYERMAEYAFAAQKDKRTVYVSFALSITGHCDCAGKPMKIVAPDIGVLASADPVAIDQASMDLLNRDGKKKLLTKGLHALVYGESIGLGVRDYDLVEVGA